MPTTLPSSLTLTPAAPLSVASLLINLVIAAVLAGLLAWHYVRFGRTLSNRRVLARTLPFVVLTTVLVISVVKSSLALSLGLVGALSIVRFRTPIKEPEELAYLFMSIAIGLGLGADQRLPTIVAFVVIMTLLFVLSWPLRREKNHNLYLNVEVPTKPGDAITFETVTQLLAEHVAVADLRRLDMREDMMQMTLYIDCDDDRALVAAMDSLKKDLPGAAISFVEQDQVLGV